MLFQEETVVFMIFTEIWFVKSTSMNCEWAITNDFFTFKDFTVINELCNIPDAHSAQGVL